VTQTRRKSDTLAAPCWQSQQQQGVCAAGCPCHPPSAWRIGLVWGWCCCLCPDGASCMCPCCSPLLYVPEPSSPPSIPPSVACPCQVLVSYKKSAIGPNFFTTRGQPPLSLDQVLAMPRPPPPHHSPAAWWNTPGPLQPLQHRAWECFTQGYDPIAQRWQPQVAEVEVKGGSLRWERWEPAGPDGPALDAGGSREQGSSEEPAEGGEVVQPAM
jgi:hypothetical protein